MPGLAGLYCYPCIPISGGIMGVVGNKLTAIIASSRLAFVGFLLLSVVLLHFLMFAGAYRVAASAAITTFITVANAVFLLIFP